MARKLRNIELVPELPNHIIHRGNNRRRLFSYPKDYRTFLWMFGRAVERHTCLMHALCLMANHIHDLLSPPSVAEGSKCVARFAQRYAQFRNGTRDASGKLFEERFKSKPVFDDNYLLAVTVYIDANPVRAGLVRDPADYPWSTYAHHAGIPKRSEIPRTLWTPSPWYFSLGATADRRADVYRKVFDAHVDDVFPELEYLDGEPYRRRLLRPDGSRAAEGKPQK